MEISRVAIVGLGSIGLKHLAALRQVSPNIDLVFVRSKIIEMDQADVKTSHTVYSVSDAIDKGVQAAIVSSPSTHHIQQATEFLKSGIHLLIEKPLSNNLELGNRFVRLADEALATKCLVGYVLRHDPAVRLFQKILKQERIGKIVHVKVECGSYLPDWRPERDYRNTVSARADLGGGVLLELSHELDIVNWLFGPINSVLGHITNSGILEVDVEDSVEVILENAQRFPIHVHLDFNRRHAIRRCLVQGVNGELSLDLLEGTVTIRPTESAAEEIECRVDHQTLLRYQMEHFFDCIAGTSNPLVTLKDGLCALEIIEAIRRSDRLRRWVTLR